MYPPIRLIALFSTLTLALVSPSPPIAQSTSTSTPNLNEALKNLSRTVKPDPGSFVPASAPHEFHVHHHTHCHGAKECAKMYNYNQNTSIAFSVFALTEVNDERLFHAYEPISCVLWHAGDYFHPRDPVELQNPPVGLCAYFRYLDPCECRRIQLPGRIAKLAALDIVKHRCEYCGLTPLKKVEPHLQGEFFIDYTDKPCDIGPGKSFGACL